MTKHWTQATLVLHEKPGNEFPENTTAVHYFPVWETSTNDYDRAHAIRGLAAYRSWQQHIANARVETYQAIAKKERWEGDMDIDWTGFVWNPHQPLSCETFEPLGEGELSLIIGKAGSGKTTALTQIIGQALAMGNEYAVLIFSRGLNPMLREIFAGFGNVRVFSTHFNDISDASELVKLNPSLQNGRLLICWEDWDLPSTDVVQMALHTALVHRGAVIMTVQTSREASGALDTVQDVRPSALAYMTSHIVEVRKTKNPILYKTRRAVDRPLPHEIEIVRVGMGLTRIVDAE